MSLAFENQTEKRVFCQDLSLLVQDLRFPLFWNAQHLELLLKIQHRKQPVTELTYLGIINRLGSPSGLGFYPVLCNLADAFDVMPATPVQWLEILKMLFRGMDMQSIVQIVNSGSLLLMDTARLQQLGSLHTDQLYTYCQMILKLKDEAPALLDLLFYFVSKLRFIGASKEPSMRLLLQFTKEILPHAEARIKPYGASFLPGGYKPPSQKVYSRALNLFAFWLLHRGVYVDFLDADFDFIYRGGTSSSIFKDFQELNFQKVIDYLPIRWLWSLSILKKHQLPLLLHFGSGKNIRTYSRLRLPISKRMAHIFHNLPLCAPYAERSLEASFLDAYWASLGGDESFRMKIPPFRWMKGRTHTYLYFSGRNLPQHFPAWERVLRLLIRLMKKEPTFLTIPAAEIRMLFGYFQDRINQGQQLHLKKSSVRSLRRHLEAWKQENRMRQITRESKLGIVESEWIGAFYEGFEMEVEGVLYQIVQITDLKTLFAEANTMHHCVWRYHPKCVKGTSSIWSLRKWEADKLIRLVTIEVNNKGWIVQAKEKYNGRPEQLHLDLIESWAIEEGLKFQKGKLR